VFVTGADWVDVDDSAVTLTVTCWAGLEVQLHLVNPGTDRAWLRSDPADLAMTTLFAAAHRGPFMLASDPLLTVEPPILRA
jgi:hypothetical protein